MKPNQDLCQLLDWDSAFFGFRIARVRVSDMTAPILSEVFEWCDQERVRCLYFLASAESPGVMELAAAGGFRVADIRITFARELRADSGATRSVRAFRESDLPSLQAIAAVSHRDTRFYNDPGFPDQRCDELYQTWIERSCHGYADTVLVAEHRLEPAGYVACHVDTEGVGSIGLLAVAKWSRGLGLGGELVAGALIFFEEAGCKRVTVATQGRNCPAQRLYQNCGFRSANVELWYHRWFDRDIVNSYRIPFNKPSLSGNELLHLAESITAGHISSDGRFTARCRDLMQTEFGVPGVLLTTSCTHALEMAALLLNIHPGDEVIIPSFTFVSTVNAFVLRGGVPIFVDVRPDTLNIDERQLEPLITTRTKAIVVVHYAGVGCEMDTITSLAKRRKIAIIEDNAHGMFGRYRSQYLGTFGTLSTLSFHETKNLTCGEGGALVVNDEKLLERAEFIRDKGTNRKRFLRGQVDKYTWVDIGSSYGLSDILAAYLFAQLEKRVLIQNTRRRLWHRYFLSLSDWAIAHNVQLPSVPEHCEQAYHMFYMVLPSFELRQGLIEHLKARGILSVFHYLPLHLSEMGQRYGGRPGQCPVSEDVSDRLLRLPFYNSLSDTEQTDVVDAIQSFDLSQGMFPQ